MINYGCTHAKLAWDQHSVSLMCDTIPADDSGQNDDLIWSSQGLEINGKPCYIHDDAAAAMHLDTEAHLISWQDKTDLTMDRFDCRLLLDSFADASMGTRAYDDVVEEDGEACDKLRWRGVELDADGCDCNTMPHDTALHAEAADDEDDEAGDDEDDAAAGDADGDNSSTLTQPSTSLAPYTPPYFTAACAHRPLLRVVHVIISRTARLVALCGARIDTMLRIRHGALPCLQFLYSDHKLRPYFDAMTEVH